jgi:transcriptional regulator with XRE-family HTH domain
VPQARRSTGNPTVRRRELGVLLRALRNARELTVEQVAAELLCSPSKVSRMETGQRGATARDIRDLCDLYNVNDPAERERLMTLAREGKQQGWWQSYALDYANYVGLEQEATTIRIFHSTVVPGLFQSADYTRALHQTGPISFTEPEIEERVTERLMRQQLLMREDPPQVEVLLDEAVLHRPIGSPAIMRDQIGDIMAAASRPRVSVRVVPYAAGAHAALESNFSLLEFGGQAPTIVYVEGLVGRIYMERQQDLDRYELVLDLLRGVALSPQDSVTFMKKIRATQIGE